MNSTTTDTDDLMKTFNDLTRTTRTMGFVTLKSLCEFIDDCDNDNSYGQGAVYHSLCLYFGKDRIKYIEKIILILYIMLIIFYKKTMKSLKEPVKYRGWKNGR